MVNNDTSNPGTPERKPESANKAANASEAAVGSPEDAIDLGEDAMGRNQAERNARRDTLKSMLEASEARVLRARRNTKPVLSIGYRVLVAIGVNAGRTGKILDADYIHSRVLVEISQNQPSLWLAFDLVEATSDDS